MTTLRNQRGDQVLSREDVKQALLQYAQLYGTDFPQSAFAPSQANRNGRPELVERYYAGRTPGEPDSEPWISLNGIKSKYDGSWNAARKDAGLPLNTTGPREDRPRRKPGEADPILNVRERRVVVDRTATVTFLERQLKNQERRADRLAEELDAEKARKAPIEGPTPREVELRKRLADETHRYKDVKRELHNAVRRESRARASADRGDRRANAAALREVDRLTQRLVEAQDENRELRGHKPVAKPVTKIRTKTKTKIVTQVVTDPVLMKTIEKLEARLAETRSALSLAKAAHAETVDTLAGYRKEAVAEALASQKVRTADRRVAEIERQLAQLMEVLAGERRVPNRAEIDALRRDGPVGDAVIVAAVKHVARSGGRDKVAALWELIAAARNRIDRL